MIKYLLFVGPILFGSTTLWAHPVAFQGSVGIMGDHSPDMIHSQINYSHRYWFATGVHHVRRPQLGDDRTATLASANFLLKRWNGPSYQGNLYANIGVGQSALAGEAEPAAYGLLQFDIEDRDYYFLAKHSQILTEENQDLKQSVLRVGITPYVDPYDGIHSWLILEWQNNEFALGEDYQELTPFLRVFYRNLLFEIGQSFDGQSKFNYITHF